ncbi:uncharacterized protein LOC143485280 [Brachyhypopomus gauderio]|uniref:uncharacterized protein LOC143485280 n=1 Tax=Brachyhypopomus gauderio TaxID=698409 RepID=UPI004041745E
MPGYATRPKRGQRPSKRRHASSSDPRNTTTPTPEQLKSDPVCAYMLCAARETVDPERAEMFRQSAVRMWRERHLPPTRELSPIRVGSVELYATEKTPEGEFADEGSEDYGGGEEDVKDYPPSVCSVPTIDYGGREEDEEEYPPSVCSALSADYGGEEEDDEGTYLPRPGQEENHFMDTPGFTTHGVPYNHQKTVIYVDPCGPAPFPYGSMVGPSNVGHVNVPDEEPSIWVIHPSTDPLLTDPRLAPEEGPSIWVTHSPTDTLLTGPDMERQRHLGQAHVQGEGVREMNPAYLQPSGANPWLSAHPVPVFTGNGGYDTECPQMSGSLEDPHTDQELYLQQLYLQDSYLKEYNRLHLYWQQLCQQHPECLPLYWDWHDHSYTSYLSYMEQYRAAFHNIRMDKAVRQKRTTQPPMRRKRKREAFYEDEGFFCDSNLGLEAQAGEVQTPSKRPHINLSEEPDMFDAMITKKGEVIFSEHFLDLLEGIPNILDVAAGMGFSI